MKRLSLSYTLSFTFERPVSVSHFSFMGLNSINEGNTVSSLHTIFPKSWMSEERDVFGNDIIYGSFFGETRELTFSLEAVLEKEECFRTLSPSDPILLYSSQSSMTKEGTEMHLFHNTLGKRGLESNLVRARYIMDALNSSFSYQKGVTNFSTTAEEAFAKGKGVCQDYSQIMLGLLREEGIAARYCCGLFPGAEESHAWIEVLSDGFWIGLDPANAKMTDDSYVPLSIGQDSRDTRLNKGIFLGGGRQEMNIDYMMVEQ